MDELKSCLRRIGQMNNTEDRLGNGGACKSLGAGARLHKGMWSLTAELFQVTICTFVLVVNIVLLYSFLYFCTAVVSKVGADLGERRALAGAACAASAPRRSHLVFYQRTPICADVSVADIHRGFGV